MTESEVKGFRLHPRARDDMADIWGYTARQWSLTQAERYIRGMQLTFENLVEFPKASRLRDEFSPPIRVKHYQSHVIVYRIEAGYIDVVRVLHGASDWQKKMGADT